MRIGSLRSMIRMTFVLTLAMAALCLLMSGLCHPVHTRVR
jgi:hypothetical protein